MSASEMRLGVVVDEMFAENAYIAHLEGRNDCLLFDPSFNTRDILDYLDREQLTPIAILNTHGHADHISGNSTVKQRWPQTPIVIGTGDAPKLLDAGLNLSRSYGIDITSPAADHTVDEGDVYAGAGFELDVLETPGHSAGHVVFLWKGCSPWTVFGGDVLFQGSVGRTDFPDGDMNQLATSIRTKLYTLPDDTVILPGHGPPTTVGQEKRHNPFVTA